MGWVGVDLDGTLAKYEGWQGPGQIGAPVPAMVERVKRWLEDGKDVRIFTARISTPVEYARAEERAAIQKWCLEHLGRVLPITNYKDNSMIELWDDHAVEVRTNTGEPVSRFRQGRNG